MHAANVIITIWLLACIVVTNSYKGMMKSNYVLDPAYTTPWKSLVEMKGSAFIFALRSTSQEDVERINLDFQRNMKMRCDVKEQNQYKNACVHEKESFHWDTICVYRLIRNDNSACLFFTERQAMHRHYLEGRDNRSAGSQKPWLQKKLDFFENAVSKARIRPIRLLEEVIIDKLSKPRTAFVIPWNHFNSDWIVFQKVI